MCFPRNTFFFLYTNLLTINFIILYYLKILQILVSPFSHFIFYVDYFLNISNIIIIITLYSSITLLISLSKTTWIQTNISHPLWQHSRSNLPAFQQFPSSLHHIPRQFISARNPICVRNFVKSNKSKSSYKTVKKRSHETSLLFLSIKEQEKTEQD